MKPTEARSTTQVSGSGPPAPRGVERLPWRHRARVSEHASPRAGAKLLVPTPKHRNQIVASQTPQGRTRASRSIVPGLRARTHARMSTCTYRYSSRALAGAAVSN
jgi:hypothetical protein